MDIIEIKKQVMNQIRQRAINAVEEAEYNKRIVNKNLDYKKYQAELDGLTIDLAKAKIKGLDCTEIEKKIENINKKQEQILKKLNFEPCDLQPKYTCKKCKDTGYIARSVCGCYKKLVTKALAENCGFDLTNITFDTCDKVDKKILNVIQKFCDKYENRKYCNILLSGNVGTGKSYLCQAMANFFIQKEQYVLFASAYQLNNDLLKYHTTFDENKASYLDKYIDCDILFIDDLGIEPVLKNVTKEYLLIIINERMRENKLTIISTNLSPEDIMDRYEERIYSRLLQKDKSLPILFEGKDNRLN